MAVMPDSIRHPRGGWEIHTVWVASHARNDSRVSAFSDDNVDTLT